MYVYGLVLKETKIELMKRTVKMKRILFALMVCALLGTPAVALPSLGWDRGDPGTTYQLWTFDDDDNPAAPVACRTDQISAKVAVASSERTNRSARITRYHGCPSAETSTRMTNQNQ